jgi:hypothetical protein
VYVLALVSADLISPRNFIMIFIATFFVAYILFCNVPISRHTVVEAAHE